MNANWAMIVFVGFVLVMLALDLGVFNRGQREITVKRAALFVGFWVAIAVAFNAGVYAVLGQDKGLQFTTCYLIEQVLSVDNMFVFVLVMQAFRVQREKQHRLLFMGVLGALLMRGALIFAGVALVHQFHWILYCFGAFLLYTAFRVFHDEQTGEEPDPKDNAVVRFSAQKFPILQRHPWLLALICLEVTDVIFALDSIPAIFSITDDSFILFSSNVLAILGLRSLYFLLAHVIDRFHMLKYGIALVLAFVGLKMLTKDVVEMPMLWSLAAIVVIIAASVGLSLILPSHRGTKPSAQ